MTYRDLLRVRDPLDVMDIPGGSGKGGGRRDAPAAKADRTPNWNTWRLIPCPELWQCVALSLDIDPYKVNINGASWRMSGATVSVFNESQEFQVRMDVACANTGQDGALRPTDYEANSRLYKVSLREFAAWVQKIGWEAPAELLTMADEQVAIKAVRAHSGKRTGAATATREARKADRSGDLKRFIEDVYEALENAGHNVGENSSRKPLPVLAGDLYTLFLVRHPEHKVALSTFGDDLVKIATVKPGRKRDDIKAVAEMLAGTFSG